MRGPQRRWRIVHVVYSFAVGGLENVVVQLINRLPAERFEHVALLPTTIGDFKRRITETDVRLIELHKSFGHAVACDPRIYQLPREIQPDVVHSCNLVGLEIVPLSWLDCVPLRKYAERDWDAHNPKGRSPCYRRKRKPYKPFFGHYVAVLKDLDEYLAHAVGVPAHRRFLIANGVGAHVFIPSPDGVAQAAPGCRFAAGERRMISTVGRLQAAKNQPLLVRAFVRLLELLPSARIDMCLVVARAGSLRAEMDSVMTEAHVQHLAWLAGARDDVADILRMLGRFVTLSQAEDTSCSLQEAMASGLPVVAATVGVTPEVVEEGIAGLLAPPDDARAMAQALWRSCTDVARARFIFQSARLQAVKKFCIDAIVQSYERLFPGRQLDDSLRGVPGYSGQS
jgi:sugar transferase (PEP-CTERM/EpsH1 system associated)